jgi:hypothetical protein
MQEKESKTKHHFYTSLVKSIIRIGAGVVLMNEYYILAGSLFIVAEILGILEEF